MISVSLSACVVGPIYEAPKTNLRPFQNKITPAAISTAPAVLDSWWTEFNDPILVDVVQRALSQNLDLAVSMARVQQARAMARRAGAKLQPLLSSHASVSVEHQSLRNQFGTISRNSPGYERNVEQYAVGPVASWELDLFGGLKRAAISARNEAQAAEADRIATRIIVAADVADAYLQIRGFQARIAVANQQIAANEKLLRLVRNRYDAGAASGREIAQADALLKQARASVPLLVIGLEQQLNRLDVLMGTQPGTYREELAKVRRIPVVPAVPPHDQPTEMLRRRPDVIAAERRLAASNERIGAAISEYYPKISLTGALGFESVSASRLFSSESFRALAGGAVRWRLFDFGRVDAEVEQATGKNAEALAAYRRSVLRATEDVENSLMTLIQTQLQLAAVQEQVKALMKARKLSEQSYRAGSIALTDVLDADRQLLLARDLMDSARAGAARAAVGVYRALGGGWTPVESAVASVDTFQ